MRTIRKTRSKSSSNKTKKKLVTKKWKLSKMSIKSLKQMLSLKKRNTLPSLRWLTKSLIACIQRSKALFLAIRLKNNNSRPN